MKQTIILLFIYNFCWGQYDVPITLYSQFNGKYDYTIIGNTHNEFDNWQNPPPQCQMLNQSSAMLNLQPNQTVVAAYLYWSGIGNGSQQPNPMLNMAVMTPDQTFITDINPPISPLLYFTNFKDITSLIQTNGNVNYSFSSYDLNVLLPDYCSNNIYYSGWNIIIVYEDMTLPNKQLNIYNGLRYVGYDNINNINFTIDNLNVVDSQNAKMTYITYNGSPNLFFNESITFNGSVLSNSLNPPDNPFNGTNSFTGSTTNWNQDIDTYDVSTYIDIGDTEANIVINSVLIRTVQTLVTSIRSELSDATVQINQVTGQGVCGNRDLLVNYTISNTNSNAVLPANVNVSLYADATFLQTVVTPTPIAVGGSLNLLTTVNIPISIPDNFTLKVVVDNNSSNISQIPESNEANNEADLAISLTPTTLITPTFTQVNPICNGQTLNNLPTTSTNGITGTWSPSINNLATTSYTFTPNAGQCATQTTITIVVNPNVIPNFTPINPICTGQTLNNLTTTSTNGITGSWSPSINNLATTMYTFTPNAGQCATTTTMTIVVNPNVVPTFTPINPICAGQTLNSLPTTSTNGITGTWSPSINNLATTTYTFTPNAGQCATQTTMTIVVNPNVVPTFTPINPICTGQILNNLPTTSTNGITGSWSPSINNLAATTYTFTPSAGQCATTTTMTIVVNPNVVPTFTPINPICAGQTLNNLPTTSTNGITGNWSPSINNSATTSYTFSPNAGQCATQTTMTIVINQTSNPDFEDVTICSSDTNFTLNNQSPNGINGTWSPAIIDLLNSSTYTFSPNSNECSTSQTITVVVVQNQLLDFSYTITNSLLENTVISITPNINGDFLYQLDNGTLQNISFFENVSSGNHTITVYDQNICENSITKNIQLIKFPKYFTPNNDGYNDVWTIQESDYFKIKSLNIFDRFGKLLKVITSNSSGWNGFYNDKMMPSDDYWFVLKYNENGVEKEFKSHFSLKR